MGGDTLTVHYTGTLGDGTKFDSSWDRCKPFRFVIGVGQVIPGWDRSVIRMSLGERSVVHVPSVMAYGEKGKGNLIPPYADLDFVVDLLKIEQGNDEGITVENSEDLTEVGLGAYERNFCMSDD